MFASNFMIDLNSPMGVIFWWGVLFAIPSGLVCCLFSVPAWHTFFKEKCSIWRVIATTFEVCLVVNFIAIWFMRKIEHYEIVWQKEYIEPFCMWAGAVGACVLIAWLIFVFMKKRK